MVGLRRGLRSVCGLVLVLITLPAAIHADEGEQTPLPVRHLAFSPDGSLLACAYGSQEHGTLRVWDWKTDRLVLEHHEAHGICSAAFSPNGNQIAIGMSTSVGRTLDLKSGEVIASFQVHAGNVRTVAYVSNGMLATGGEDRSIRLWNATTGKQLAELGQHKREVHEIAVSPDGRYLVSGAYSPDCRLWDLQTMREVAKYDSSRLVCPNVCFDSSGRYFLAARWDNQVTLRDTASQKLRARISMSATYGISISPDGSFILGQNDSRYLEGASLGIHNAAKSRTAELMRLAKLWSDDDYQVREKASREFERIGGEAIPLLNSLSKMKNPEIRTRAREARRRISIAQARTIDVGHRSAVLGAAFAPDNVHVATGERLGSIKIWEYRSEKIVKTIAPLLERVVQTEEDDK